MALLIWRMVLFGELHLIIRGSNGTQLYAMEYFNTALRQGNIAKAAADLNIAASAVSHDIDQAEAQNSPNAPNCA